MTMHTRVERGFRRLLALAVPGTFRRCRGDILDVSGPRSFLCANNHRGVDRPVAPVPFIGRLISQSESEQGRGNNFEPGRVATFKVEESFRVDLPNTVSISLLSLSGPAGSGSAPE